MPPVGSRPQLPVGVCRFAIEGTVNGFPWANILHAEMTPTSAINQAALDSFAASTLTAYQTRFRASFPTTWVAQRIDALVRTSSTIAIVSQVNAPAAGLVVGTSALPLNVAVCISWRVSLYYRGGHPRTYLAGAPANQYLDARQWSVAFSNAIAAAANSFLGDVNALTPGSVTNIDLGFVSYSTGGAYRAQAAFFPFNNATVDTRIDSQRRRLGPDV
jgi:hypothetical protein